MRFHKRKEGRVKGLSDILTSSKLYMFLSLIDGTLPFSISLVVRTFHGINSPGCTMCSPRRAGCSARGTGPPLATSIAIAAVAGVKGARLVESGSNCGCEMTY